MIKGEVGFPKARGNRNKMLKAASKLDGPSTLARKIGSVNGVVLK